MLRLFALALICALLAACAAPWTRTEQDVPAKPELAAKAPERPFPNDSLYDLLVAEFALRRQAYDVTLERYMAQAPVLRDPGVSAHTTNLAQFLQRQDEAMQSALLWVELEPESPEANNTMAVLLAQRGRTIEALPYLVAVERHAGSANFPILLNGIEKLNEAERTELVERVNALSAEFPQNTQLMLTQALIHTEFKQYDLALDDLDELLELEPDQTQAMLLETRILIEQKAQHPYARLQQALVENPDDNELRLQYARLLTITDMTAAREQFEILAKQSPQDGDLLFSLALITRENGDTAAARAYMQQAIAQGHRVDEAYYYLGRMAEEDKDPEEAIANYMRVAGGKEYLAASTRTGQILVGSGQLERSHKWFDEQREKYPQLQDQLYGMEADILVQAGSVQEAMQLLNQGLTAAPASTSLRYARAMLSEQQDDLVLMEKDLRIIIAAEPDNATALNALGYTLADRTTRYAEALELVTRALKLQPNEPAILDSMGWVLFRTQRYDESIQYLTRAYAMFPDPEVAAHLGEVLWVKGDTETAMAIWQGALLRDPDHPVLLRTLERLQIDIPSAATAVGSPAENQP